MGSAVKNIGNVVGSVPVIGKPAKSLLGGIADVALGEKDPGQAAQTTDLRSEQERGLQEKALGQYGQILGQDTGAQAASQIAQQEQQARQGAVDQEQRARQLVAQRGLGGSASGINAILGQQRGLGEQLGAIRSQRPGLESQLQQQKLGFVTQGLGGLSAARSGSQIYSPAVASKGRSGGLIGAALPIAGQVLGGMAGAGAFGGAKKV